MTDNCRAQSRRRRGGGLTLVHECCAVEKELARVMDGLAGLRDGIRNCGTNPHNAREFARALTLVDAALAETVRELYGITELSEGV